MNPVEIENLSDKHATLVRWPDGMFTLVVDHRTGAGFALSPEQAQELAKALTEPNN